MRMPKGFSKWSLVEQESWLVKKYQEVSGLEEEIRKMLSSVRGGQVIKTNDDITRPDEAILKS